MNFGWIDLDHSLLEWALFAAAILGLILVKLYAKRRRDEVNRE